VRAWDVALLPAPAWVAGVAGEIRARLRGLTAHRISKTASISFSDRAPNPLARLCSNLLPDFITPAIRQVAPQHLPLRLAQSINYRDRVIDALIARNDLANIFGVSALYSGDRLRLFLRGKPGERVEFDALVGDRRSADLVPHLRRNVPCPLDVATD
jgi:hypothetical protein